MKWVVGLGNPGANYEQTRHNIGWTALDEIAKQWSISITQSKCNGLIGEGKIDGTKVALIKPMTYMNRSGECVRAYLDYYKVNLSDMIVVYDDMDTAIGKIRLRLQGSSGGHNGIRSMIAHLGTEQFQRVRIGISRPAAGVDIAQYVLSEFRKEELPAVQSAIHQTAEAIQFALTYSFEQTMAKFNVN
jgi:PTH1 family peptidyl-tRNA hydrolase